MTNQTEEARKQREEEELTSYPNAGTIEKYEFKILRSMWGAFKDPEKRDEILRLEAENGWRFLEIFDAYRMRVYRRRDTRTAVPGGIDPYRTNAHDGGMRIGGLKRRNYYIAAGISAALIFFAIASLIANTRRLESEMISVEKHYAFLEEELARELDIKLKSLEKEDLPPETMKRRHKMLMMEKKKAFEECREKRHRDQSEIADKRRQTAYIWGLSTILGIMLVWLIAIFWKTKQKDSNDLDGF